MRRVMDGISDIMDLWDTKEMSLKQISRFTGFNYSILRQYHIDNSFRALGRRDIPYIAKLRENSDRRKTPEIRQREKNKKRERYHSDESFRLKILGDQKLYHESKRNPLVPALAKIYGKTNSKLLCSIFNDPLFKDFSGYLRQIQQPLEKRKLILKQYFKQQEDWIHS